MTHQPQRENGFSYVALIIATAAVTSVVMVGLRMWQSKQTPIVSKELKEALANADCANEKDTDLCKFYVSTGAQKFTTIDFTDLANGVNSSGSYQTDNNANYHITIKNGDKTYEVIGIGTTLYSKDEDGSTWWKQEVRQSDLDKYNSAPGTGQVFTADTKDGVAVTYRKQETAACPTVSNLTCLKYQVSDPTRMSDAQFIWFDNSYYQLQRLKTIGSNSTMDATFGYKKVTIEAPDDSTDLPSNKYIVPGQSDPVTIPEGGVGPDVKDLFGN